MKQTVNIVFIVMKTFGQTLDMDFIHKVNRQQNTFTKCIKVKLKLKKTSANDSQCL